MLDYELSASVSEQQWDELATRAMLPGDKKETHQEALAPPDECDARRRYSRLQVRGRATVQRNEEVLGVYTIDISPAGIGFFSPVQLFPKERVTLTFEEYGQLQLQITRCRRVQQQCYSCGAQFFGQQMNPAAYRKLLHALKV